MAGTKKPVETKKRVRLSPDARRAEIVTAAQTLFFQHGWEAVTISDVLAATGISKGGFYHHFSAKEDLLDGVVGMFTANAVTTAEAASAGAVGDGLMRLNAFLEESSRWKAENAAQLGFILDVMIRPGNDVLFQRITNATTLVVLPVLRTMIVAGVEDGSFNVPDPEIVAEVILGLGAGRRVHLKNAVRLATDGRLDDGTEMLNERMVAEGRMLDRLLGVPDGSIALARPDDYRSMLRVMTNDRRGMTQADLHPGADTVRR